VLFRSDRRFDELVDFAEIGEFIDTPVKFYSSGMAVRLGFASAVVADPDLLIVDEVLAVGDVAFQAKCFDRMIEMRENGATLLVVSHNLMSMRRLAEQALVLHDGEVRFRGTMGDSISIYHELLRESFRPAAEGAAGHGGVEISSVEVLNEEGLATANVESGETATFVIHIRVDHRIERAVFGLAIATEAGQLVYGENSASLGAQAFEPGAHALKVKMPLRLVSSSYTATAVIRWGEMENKDQVASAPKIFYVSGRRLIRGVVDLDAVFEVDGTGVARASDAVPAPALGADPSSDR